MLYPGGETRCISSTSSRYGFQVIRGDPDKLLIQFQGGGACWSEFTYKLGACLNATKSDSAGMFDKGQAGNPFKDFTIVNVVYCSGDLFMANQTRSWNGA